MAAQFHDLHQRRYGFANETRALEVVNVRVRMVSAAEAFTPAVQPLHEGDGSHALINTPSTKACRIAQEEIEAGKISYVKTEVEVVKPLVEGPAVPILLS